MADDALDVLCVTKSSALSPSSPLSSPLSSPGNAVISGIPVVAVAVSVVVVAVAVSVIALALITLELLLNDRLRAFWCLNTFTTLLWLLLLATCVAAVAEPAAAPTTRAVIATLIASLDLILDVTFGSPLISACSSMG